MINYRRNFLIIAIFGTAWLLTDLDFNKEDPNSLEKMFKWSPLSTVWCMKSIEIAGEGPSLHNLHGLNCPQIYNLALEKVDKYYNKAINNFSSALDAIEKNPGSEAIIHFAPVITADSSMYNPNDPQSGSRIYDAKKIKQKLESVKKESDAIKKELDRVLPIMPWTNRVKFGGQIYVPVRYELTNNSTKNVGNVKVPSPTSECDMNYSEILEKAGLVPEEISIHGPDDSDFNGYGCPYRITPKPGSLIPKKSKVTFRSAWEGS